MQSQMDLRQGWTAMMVVHALLTMAVPASGQARFHYEQAWALSGPCCGDSGDDA
ncbi:MAG: hypothetical protein IT177_07855 [Acidobacteria bacterium]|nr:hypothetical protein [Acidobacteriota bacterium]